MFVYICVDCSMRMRLEKGEETVQKIQKAIILTQKLVENFDKSDVVNINLIALNSKPKIVCERAKTSADVTNAFNEVPFFDEKPNFEMLWDLVFNRHQALNYELIVILNSTNALINELFPFPCPVQYISMNTISNKLRDFLTKISIKSGIGLYQREPLIPIEIFNQNIPNQIIQLITGRQRSQNDVTLKISENLKIDVTLWPGLPICGIVVLNNNNDETGGQINNKDIDYSIDDIPSPIPTTIPPENNFYLLGFVKISTILCLSNISLNHVVKCDGSNEEQKFNLQAFAETMGAETVCGIFEHISSGEQCALIPQRTDSNSLWSLSLQFFHSKNLQWNLISENLEKPKQLAAELRGASYTQVGQCNYWIDNHGINSDILKFVRSLKRPDRRDFIIKEFEQLIEYANATGQKSFGATLANILETRCIQILPEYRQIFISYLEQLKKNAAIIL